MATKNALRVMKFRRAGGYIAIKEKYYILRHKYDIKSVKANEMKFWSVDRILDYLIDNNIKPVKTLKEVDRL